MQALGSPGEAARASHSPSCRDSGCWGESLSAQSHAVAPSPQPGAEPAPSSRWQCSLRSLPASGPAARGDTRAVSLSSSWLQRSPASVCSLWELIHQGMVLPRGFQRGSLVFPACPVSFLTFPSCDHEQGEHMEPAFSVPSSRTRQYLTSFRLNMDTFGITHPWWDFPQLTCDV